MKKVFAFIASLSALATANAEWVGEAAARTAAEAFLSRDALGSTILGGRTVSGIRCRGRLWIASLEPSGHIVIGGSDFADPIVAFSKNDFAEPNPESPAFAVLEAAGKSMESLEAQEGVRHARWSKFLDGGSRRRLLKAADTPPASAIVVEPFLMAHYSQNQPYNDFTPVHTAETNDLDTYRGRAPSGCMATAIAQMFHHFRWPARIDNVLVCDHNVTNAIIGAGVYRNRFDGNLPIDWSQIATTYPNEDPDRGQWLPIPGNPSRLQWKTYTDLRGMLPESERHQIARLFLLCDVLGRMQFRPRESVSFYQSFVDNAGEWYTPGRWLDMQKLTEADCSLIREELSSGVPLQVGVTDHQVMAHGWAESGDDKFIYLNFGWGGENDGFYNLDNSTAGDFAMHEIYVGHHPRAKPQLDPLPNVCADSLTLSWHFPDFYANRLSGFSVAVQKQSPNPSDFFDDFSASSGSSPASDCTYVTNTVYDYWGEILFSGDNLLYASAYLPGTYTFPGKYTLTSASVLTFRIRSYLALGCLYEVQARFNGGEWTTIASPSLAYKTDSGWSTERLYMGDHGGETVQLRIKASHDGKNYYKNGCVLMDDLRLTSVLSLEEPTPIWVEPTVRTYSFTGLEAGAAYSFTVTPTISGTLAADETSEPARVHIAGEMHTPVPGEETFTNKTLEYSVHADKDTWSILGSAEDETTIGDGWHCSVTANITGSVTEDSFAMFDWTTDEDEYYGIFEGKPSYDVISVSFADSNGTSHEVYTRTNTTARTDRVNEVIPLNAPWLVGKKGKITISYEHKGGGRSLGGKIYSPIIANIQVPTVPDPEFIKQTLVALPAPTIDSVTHTKSPIVDGVFAECSMGGNVFNVSCSPGVTGLKAYVSAASFVTDSDIAVHDLGGGKFVVELDASGVPFWAERTRALLTLAATDSNGTTAYRDVSLRFSYETDGDVYMPGQTIKTWSGQPGMPAKWSDRSWDHGTAFANGDGARFSTDGAIALVDVNERFAPSALLFDEYAEVKGPGTIATPVVNVANGKTARISCILEGNVEKIGGGTLGLASAPSGSLTVSEGTLVPMPETATDSYFASPVTISSGATLHMYQRTTGVHFSSLALMGRSKLVFDMTPKGLPQMDVGLLELPSAGDGNIQIEINELSPMKGYERYEIPGLVLTPDQISSGMISPIGDFSITYSTDGRVFACKEPTFYVVDGVLVDFRLNGCTDITIPDGVTSITNRLFANNDKITSVTIPDSVKRIGDSAFYACTSLASVTFGNGVESIGASAFSRCTALIDVAFMGNAPTIGSSCFSYGNTARVVRVKKGTSGWNVSIPGIWNGMQIEYVKASIRNVTARQRYPWNGKVDISYEIVGDVTSDMTPGNLPVMLLTGTDLTSGERYAPWETTSSGDFGFAEGTHHVVWDLGAQNPELMSNGIVFRVACCGPTSSTHTTPTELCYAESAAVKIDFRTGARESDGWERLAYSSLWDGDTAATVAIAQNGVVIANGLAGEGELDWSAQTHGEYVLKHTTYKNGAVAAVETATFVVPPKDIAAAKVSIDCGDVIYNGHEQRPAVDSVRWNGRPLAEGTDYTLSYSKNVNAGTATISIYGKGFFVGTYTTNFTITAKTLDDAMVGDVEDTTYNGSQIKPTPDVTDHERGVSLVLGADYTITYANNVNAGTASLTIVGRGNYTGNVTRDFTIEKATYDMSGARWDYDGNCVFDGQPKTVRVVGLPAGIVPVYTDDTATLPGEYTTRVSLEYDSANYYKPASMPDLHWAICIAGEGTVAPPKTLVAGKSASWKATAAKGSVFSHWEGKAVDALGLPNNTRRNPSLQFNIPDGFSPDDVVAVFVSVDSDRLSSLWLSKTEPLDLNALVDGLELLDDSLSYVSATVNGLPTGLKFDAKTMAITGKPTKSGAFTLKITAKNASGYQRSENLLLLVRDVSGAAPTVPIPDVPKQNPLHPLTTVVLSAQAGTASGTGVYAEGKKISISAKAANKEYVFAGWYKDAKFTEPMSFAAGDYRSPSQSVYVPEVRYVYARFATAKEDAASLSINVTNAVTESDGTYTLDVSACVGSITEPKITVAGLPKGLKYDAKTLKISGAATSPGTYVVKLSASNSSVSGKSAPTKEFTLTVPNLSCDALPNLRPETDRYVVTCGVDFDAALVDCALGKGWEGCTVKAAGLPSGLKFAQDKAGACSITGIPTKDGIFTVSFTASKKGAANQTATITLNVKALPDWAQGTFNGYARTTSGEYGSAAMTVSSAGKVSGNILLGGGKWAFSAASYDVSSADADGFVVRTGVKVGNAIVPVQLSVVMCAAPEDAESGLSLINAAATGRMESAEEISLALWRTMWKDKSSAAAAKTVLAGLEGIYTVSLAPGVDFGSGYLSLAVGKDGNVKASGKLADGTGVSAASPIMYSEDAGYFAYLYAAPSSYKGGAFALDVWIWPDKTLGSYLGINQWTSRDPQATGDYGHGFERPLRFVGAYYDKLSTLNDHYSSLRFDPGTPPKLAYTYKETALDENNKKATRSETRAADAVDLSGQSGLVVTVNAKGAFDVQKATKPTQDKATNEWSYTGANDGALTLSFTQATGIFKGSYTFWYDYISALDSTTAPAKSTTAHSSVKISFEGIMVQGSHSLDSFYLCDAVGSYIDSKTGKEKTYKFKESYPLLLKSTAE